MAKVFNRILGGGGSGGASANIYVTGLSQTDSVTMTTPSGGTVQGVWDEVSTYEDTQVPLITADNPSVYQSNYYNTNYAWKAFDNVSTTHWGINTFPSYMWYDFGTLTQITSFEIAKQDNTNYRPISFDLIIADDDQITVVESYTFEATTVVQTFAVSNEAWGKRWGIRINSGNKNMALISMLQMHGVKQVSVPCFKFLADEYGMHTITATNGVKTSTEEVLVDALMDYWVEMDYKLWLE